MKKETLTQFITASQKETPNENMLIVSHAEDGQVVSTFVGDPDSIAQAIHAVIHNEKDMETARSMYSMIKNIVFNIIRNNTPIADDMIDMIENVLGDEHNSSNTVSMFPNIGEA